MILYFCKARIIYAMAGETKLNGHLLLPIGVTIKRIVRSDLMKISPCSSLINANRCLVHWTTQPSIDGQFQVFVRDAVISSAPIYYVVYVFKFKSKIIWCISVARQKNTNLVRSNLKIIGHSTVIYFFTF